MRKAFAVLPVLAVATPAFAQISGTTGANPLLNPAAPTYTTTLTEGNSGSGEVASTPSIEVLSGPWQAFNGSPTDTTSVHSSVIKTTAAFPLQTSVAISYPAWGCTSTVCAFRGMGYGNYLDGSPNGVTAVRINTITALTESFDDAVTQSTSGAANLVLDFYAFATSAGTTASMADEIEVYLDPSPGALRFINRNPVVGTYTSAAIGSTPSETWKVTYEASNYNKKPYYQFSLPSGAIFHSGSFDLLAAMNYLKAQGKLTGTEYFTGVAFGAEVLRGTVTQNINAISVNYTHR